MANGASIVVSLVLLRIMHKNLQIIDLLLFNSCQYLL